MDVRSVRPVWVLLCACAVVATTAARVAGSGAQGDTMSALVTVLAPATGPVTDLTAKDFTVHSGKHALEVSAADRATQPLSVELLVDNSQLPGADPTADLRAALQGFVQTVRAGEADVQIGMYTFAGAPIPVVKIGAPAADLDRALAQLIPAPQSSGALLEALEDASRDLLEYPPPRRAIVSVDLSSAESTPDTAVRNVEKVVYQSGATVWAVSVSGHLTETPKRDAILTPVTRRTGGERISIVQTTGLPTQLKAIANSLISQYTIQFARPSGQIEELKIDTPKGKALATMFAR